MNEQKSALKEYFDKWLATLAQEESSRFMSDLQELITEIAKTCELPEAREALRRKFPRLPAVWSWWDICYELAYFGSVSTMIEVECFFKAMLQEKSTRILRHYWSELCKNNWALELGMQDALGKNIANHLENIVGHVSGGTKRTLVQ